MSGPGDGPAATVRVTYKTSRNGAGAVRQKGYTTMNWTETHADLICAINNKAVDVANVHHGYTLPGRRVRGEAAELVGAGVLERESIVYRVADWQQAAEVCEAVYGDTETWRRPRHYSLVLGNAALVADGRQVTV